MDKKDVRVQIQQMQAEMQALIQSAKKDQLRFVTLSCAEIERTAKSIMRDSPTNPDVTYGKKGHHPSYAGNPPAPDTGTLMRSITHEVSGSGKQVVGEVGSIINNSDYPRFLEYGTSKMKPRPWLSASLIKCQSWMSNLWKEIFR